MGLSHITFINVLLPNNHLSIIELWGAGLGVYLFVRFPVWALFQKFTVHRGSIHSIGIALLCCFAAAALSFHFFAKQPFIAWLVGLFIFLGFILHLVLDEIYSVDFMGYRLKRSFGTALKLFDFKARISTAVISLCLIALWFVTPDASQFIDTLSSPETYQLIMKRMM